MFSKRSGRTSQRHDTTPHEHFLVVELENSNSQPEYSGYNGLANYGAGMFLWVRLVLDSLETIYSPEAFRDVVKSLPSDLETLYERVLLRICSAPGPQEYGGVPHIISWICCAQRPLLKHELLQGLAFSKNDAVNDARSIPLAQVLDHCKPFIEERSDSTIVFVHFSVQE
ncbi:hypothetical protein IAQ61_000327 [Plenodomus lingam]|uniref:uncharacterized protein n=1 Tax=Leptosphaeria maculans TaxID=5022 RepID=UPI00331EFA19|nr:hypothetical protein IAQ61_000327 [Plenodomus lingam]